LIHGWLKIINDKNAVFRLKGFRLDVVSVSIVMLYCLLRLVGVIEIFDANFINLLEYYKPISGILYCCVVGIAPQKNRGRLPNKKHTWGACKP
jgi:hypothetical protein